MKQHKLQLVQQSPARKNVRKLLQQAASDNTVLSNRVEELRAQRNALCVTKAALTAQVHSCKHRALPPLSNRSAKLALQAVRKLPCRLNHYSRIRQMQLHKMHNTSNSSLCWDQCCTFCIPCSRT